MPVKDISTVLEEIVKRVNEHARRIRILEERNRASDMRTASIEEGLLKTRDLIREEFEKLNEKILDLERRIMKIENEIERINKDMKKMAKKTEIKELEAIFNIFSPLKSKFITKEEVEDIIKRYLERKG